MPCRYRGWCLQELLGLLVTRGLAIPLAVLLVRFCGLVGRSRSDELVRQGRLVLVTASVGDLETLMRSRYRTADREYRPAGRRWPRGNRR